MAAFEHIIDSINTTSNTDKVICLNQMIERWRRLFEEPPSKELVFTVNEQNILCLDGVMICDMTDVDAASACCDFEAFFFESMTKGYYRILITWDFDNNVHIREIALVLHDDSDEDQL